MNDKLRHLVQDIDDSTCDEKEKNSTKFRLGRRNEDGKKKQQNI